MARAGSWAVAAGEDPQRTRERAESARTVAHARAVNERAERIARKLQHMSELYRERLEGVRDDR